MVSRSGYGSSDGSSQESSVGLDHEIGNGSDGDSAGQDRVLDIDDVELPAGNKSGTATGPVSIELFL